MELLVVVGAFTGLVGGAAGVGGLVLQWRNHHLNTSGLELGRLSNASMMNRHGTAYLDTFVGASNPSSIPNGLVNVVLKCSEIDGSLRSWSAEVGLVDEAVT